ncbi:MAG: tRNA (adenosine(37)-N6)-dimethylallyltransferase MiaA [Bacteroidota bacterium]
MLSKNLFVIAGPTASGKTSLAITLAGLLRTEIISADSRQFYREMNIGTAKPSPEELARIPHHFIGHISVHDDYDAGKFGQDALSRISALFLTYDNLVMAGGSGLYIDAVCKGFDELPDVDAAIREELTRIYKEKGLGPLRELLKKHDPVHYQASDVNNPHRLIRALEICIGTGLPYSSFRKGKGKQRDFNVITIGLDPGRELLYARINERVDRMMKAGLADEARNLLGLRHLNALQTVGYKELFDHFENKLGLDEAVQKIKQNTRNFAKRQMTWFRKDKTINWFDPAQESEIIRFVKTRPCP